MRERYEKELQELNCSIINMGKMIEVAIESAFLVLMAWDKDSCCMIIENDKNIDEMEKEIERHCVQLLLQQQPMATDLRFITSALKMITDMERIGDHAADIADLVMNMDGKKNSSNNLGKYANAKLDQLGSEIQKMLKASLDAYINHDISKAKNVINGIRDIYAHLVFGLIRPTVGIVVSLCLICSADWLLGLILSASFAIFMFLVFLHLTKSNST